MNTTKCILRLCVLFVLEIIPKKKIFENVNNSLSKIG